MEIRAARGDDLDAMTQAIRQGQNQPFTVWPPAVEYNAKAQVIGEYFGDVSDEALGVDKKVSRFLTRNARLALKAARNAIAQSGADVGRFGCIVGSGRKLCEISDGTVSLRTTSTRACDPPAGVAATCGPSRRSRPPF